MTLVVDSDARNERGEAMTKTQGFGTVQHAGREFQVGGVVQVTAEDSVRQGQLGLVTEIRSGSYAVVALHPDGQERAWRPEELAVTAGVPGLAGLGHALDAYAMAVMAAGREIGKRL